MRIVVTGGSGFIGLHVVQALGERGHDVVVVDLAPHPDPEVEAVVGDLRDPEVVASAVRPGTDAIVHLAASTSVLQSMNDPHGVFANNVGVTEALLERCRSIGVGRFVFASTNAVCGDVGGRVIDEGMVLRPLTPYGATKAAGEMLMSASAGSYDLLTVALRFTNVYGRGMQVKDSIVARLMRAILNDTTFSVYGDGEQRRDYVYVTDAVAAVLLGLELPAPDTLTIGTAHSVSVNGLIELTRQVTGAALPVEHVEPKKGEMRAVEVSIDHARSVGFQPAYDLEAGLAETWEQFRVGHA